MATITQNGISYQSNVDPRTGQRLGAGVSNLSLPSNIATPFGQNGTPVIDTNTLTQNGSQFAIPQTNPAVNTPQSFVQGIQMPPIQIAAAGAGVGQQEASMTALQKRLADSMSKLSGKGGEQLRLEQEAGIPTQNKEIAALSEQLAATKAAFDAKAGAVATNTFGVESQDTRINAVNRQSAIQLGGMAAVLMAKQGNLANARAEVDRTLALEFDPIKEDIENTKTFLEINAQNFSVAEKRRAENLAIQIRKQERAVDAAREDRKFNANLGLELAKLGKIGQDAFSKILSGEMTVAGALKDTGINVVTPGSDPLDTLTRIISDNGLKTDDKLKLTGSVIAATQKLAKLNPSGDFRGLGPIRAGNLTVGQAGQTNRTYLSQLKGTVESWMTGASVSEQQQKRIEKDLIPNESDTDRQVRQKINALTNYMLDFSSGNLATQGITYRPPQVDLFAPIVPGASQATPESFLLQVPNSSPSITNQQFFQ